jgi:hypothetical protein
MKSRKSEPIQVRWLIGEIRDLDKMIAMHRSTDNDYMAEQYEARRLKYFKELISLLTNSAYTVSGRETFPLIQSLLKENYPKHQQRLAIAVVHKSFDHVLHFYESQKIKNYSSSRAQTQVIAEPDAVYRKK